MNVQLVDTGKYFKANFAFGSVRLLLPGLATVLEVPGGDLVSGEQLAAVGTGMLQAILQTAVGLLVERQRVAPLGGEGAVLKGTAVHHLGPVYPLMSLEVTGGGEGSLTSTADVILSFGMEQSVLLHVGLAGGAVRAPLNATGEDFWFRHLDPGYK